MKFTVPTIAQFNRFVRLIAAWAATLYGTVSAIQSTSWGTKNSVITLAGAVLLWIEHNNATPNVTVLGTAPAPKP